MHAIDKLIEADRTSPKRIAIAGDAMTDVWVHGHLEIGQENAPKFIEDDRVETPGGACNACVQLDHWESPSAYFTQHRSIEPTKTRFLVDGKVVFRHDDEQMHVEAILKEQRRTQFLKMFDGAPLAILISDYDKGFLSSEFIKQIIQECQRRGIPCVADAKREPTLYDGAIIKCNIAYDDRYENDFGDERRVTTCGEEPPLLLGGDGSDDQLDKRLSHHRNCMRSIQVVNHVGAGDAFAAHLALALAHGLSLVEAAEVAHSAGRVFVQHPHCRPPWPHEIRRDLDPVGGKIVDASTIPALRQSTAGRIAFTNGCYDLFGPHHLYCLQEARKHGDVLVVGVNSDESVSRLKGAGRPVIPQEQRAMLLAGLECVDWVFVFGGDTPAHELAWLKPDVRVKGNAPGLNDAGNEFCKEVVLVPLMEGWSTTTTLAKIRR